MGNEREVCGLLVTIGVIDDATECPVAADETLRWTRRLLRFFDSESRCA